MHQTTTAMAALAAGRGGSAIAQGLIRFEDVTFAYVPGEPVLNHVSFEVLPGQRFHVTPGTVHRMTAIEDCDVIEVSTPELDDVVRLEDRYGRQDPPKA